MSNFVNVFVSFLFITSNLSSATSTEGLDLLVITVATEETDGYLRFKQSIDTHGLNLRVFGMNEEWLGGDVSVTTGGAHKLNLLKQGLVEYKDRDDLVLLFTDSYDVIFAANKEEILSKFVASEAKLMVSAESTVWPDRSLKDKYPVVERGYPYLCSGGIIGYASTYWKALNAWPVKNNDDDQLFYTLIYLNETLRNELGMKLDHTAELIQNLNFAQTDVEIMEIENQARLKNERFNTLPCVIHGNGPSKISLNRIGNYVPKNWHSDYGCRQCDRNLLDLSEFDTLPLIQVAIFIPYPVPFLNEFFDRVSNLDYPKSRINIFIYNQVEEAEKSVHFFLLRLRNQYNKVEDLDPHSHVDEPTARNMALIRSLEDECDYQFSVNANTQLTNPLVLNFLLRKNRKIIAPMLYRPRTNWGNFWGALNEDGYYLRSPDYLSIISRTRIGVWNVPYISEVYLSKASLLREIAEKTGNGVYNGYYEADMNMCANMRKKGMFMYVTNELEFGRTLYSEGVQTVPRHPDMWQIFSNPVDWEEKHIHPGFWDTVQSEMKDITQPCPDVFMFPLFTETMADHLVDTMNDFGKWSNGQNEDERISGGYENVPTRDIHMNQVGYEKEWLHLLKHYPARIVEKVYPGFFTKAQSIMMFVVRYKPDEQPFLRPHHDASTWTMNVALNNGGGVDYEGGGCRFIRYNCSVTEIPKGYALIHPGRLTHYHEGLYTTKGTRYIVVSFVDP